MKKRCFNCMKEYEEQYEVCPHCGYVDGSPPAEAYHLAPGEILNHKYIVGTAIDSGGFGIIYRAWDAQMEQVVAIKEYFPNGVVSRVPGQNDIIIYSGKNREVFRKGVDRFDQPDGTDGDHVLGRDAGVLVLFGKVDHQPQVMGDEVIARGGIPRHHPGQQGLFLFRCQRRRQAGPAVDIVGGGRGQQKAIKTAKK